MSGFLTLLFGILIGYQLRPLVAWWKRRKYQKKFKPTAIKPYRPKRSDL